MLLITRRKRYAALFLAVFLSCSCAMGAHQEAHALAIGGVAVTAGEVVAFLLAAFGIVAASVAVYENADSIKAWGEEQLEEFKLYASGFAAVTGKTAEELAADIDVWTALAIAGTLDKASYVFDLFKKWCEGLAMDESSSSSGSGSVANPVSGMYVYDSLEWDCLYITSSGAKAPYRIMNARGPCYTMYFINSQGRGALKLGAVTVSLSPFWRVEYSASGIGTCEECTILIDGREYVYYGSIAYLNSVCWEYGKGFYYELNPLIQASFLNLGDLSWNDYRYVARDLLAQYVIQGLNFGSFAITESVASKVIARDRAIANVDIVPADAIADSGVETVPIDWSKIRSVAGALSDVVEGTSTIDAVLNQVGVEVVDKTGAITVPVPPADTGEFTMEGLESLFPFCLPFDLVDFFQVLAAEPEAPHFQWPIRYMASDGPKEYVVDIDLSPFDPAAAILRNMELLAFIVGLIIITREKMIRG